MICTVKAGTVADKRIYVGLYVILMFMSLCNMNILKDLTVEELEFRSVFTQLVFKRETVRLRLLMTCL